MKKLKPQPGGFSLIELLISLAIGLVLVGAVIAVFISQTRMSKTVVSQSSLQNSENAISALITPTIRSAGFSGCSSLSSSSLLDLNAGGPPPLGTLAATSAFVMGYDATGTAGAGSSYAIAANNSANSGSGAGWLPALDATLVGKIETGSDVLIVLGAAPESSSIGVTSIASGSNLLSVQSTAGVSVNQFGIVTDCLKSSIFQVTGVTATTITHDIGTGAAMTNASASLSVDYPVGAQFIPLQQTAFFVAQGQGDQSVLMSATYLGGTWTVQPLVPGVDNMQILYGIGGGGTTTEYVPANQVANWAQVSAIQIGLLLQGQTGSGDASTSTGNTYNVLGTTVKAPTDGRLRHVFQLSVNLRNAK